MAPPQARPIRTRKPRHTGRLLLSDTWKEAGRKVYRPGCGGFLALHTSGKVSAAGVFSDVKAGLNFECLRAY